MIGLKTIGAGSFYSIDIVEESNAIISITQTIDQKVLIHKDDIPALIRHLTRIYSGEYDFSTMGPEGEQTDFNFKNKTAYCHSLGKEFYLTEVVDYDNVNRIAAVENGKVIILSEEVQAAYNKYLVKNQR